MRFRRNLGTDLFGNFIFEGDEEEGAAPPPVAPPPKPGRPQPRPGGERLAGPNFADEMLDKAFGAVERLGSRNADVMQATVPPISPREMQMRDGPPPIAMMRGNHSPTYAYPPAAGSGPWPEYDRPYDPAMAQWAREAGRLQDERAAKVAASGQMGAFLNALAEGARTNVIREGQEWSKSPEARQLMMGDRLIAEGVPAVEALSRVGEMRQMQNELAPPAAGPGGGPAPRMADPVSAFRRAVPRLATEVIDPKTGGLQEGFKNNPGDLLQRVYNLDEGQTLRQNWPAVQAFARVHYTPSRSGTWPSRRATSRCWSSPTR